MAHIRDAQRAGRCRRTPVRADSPHAAGASIGPVHVAGDRIADIDARRRAPTTERWVGVDDDVAALKNVGADDAVHHVAGVRHVRYVKHNHRHVGRHHAAAERRNGELIDKEPRHVRLHPAGADD